MKQFDIDNFYASYNDFGNFFNVYQEDNDISNTYFNISKTVNLINTDNIPLYNPSPLILTNFSTTLYSI